MNFDIDITSEAPIVRDVKFKSGAYELKGTLFHPGRTPKAAVVLNGATGVPARYYMAFATWLAEEQGVACLTYDYRDFGASKVSHPRVSTVDMAEWAVNDADAARRFVTSAVPNRPVWVIGHSLGALAIACQDNLDRIDRVIAVASGPVHTSDHPWSYQATARMFWFGLGPLVVRMMGYLPGERLGVGADLPAGVYWQWRRWCTSKGFFNEDVGRSLPFPDWTGFGGDAKYVAVADDVMVPPQAVWRGMQFHREAWARQLTLDPYDYGLQKIGHIGVFHPDSEACWADLIA